MDILKLRTRRRRQLQKRHRIDLFAAGSSPVSANSIPFGIIDPSATEGNRSNTQIQNGYTARPHDKLLKAMAELEAYRAERDASSENSG